MRPRGVKNRLIAGVAVLAVALALVGLAVVAGGDDGPGTPATLPVLGAGGAARPSAAMDSSLRIAPTTYEAGKLPGLPDEADAWTLPAAAPDGDAVAHLADVLGVDGAVTRTDTGWSVGTDARRLDVQAVAGMPWSLYESRPADTSVSSPPVDCPPGASCTTVTATAPDCPPERCTTSTESFGGNCAADDCPSPMLVDPPRPADLPSKAEAEAAGRKLLTRLGVDLDQAEVRVDDGITVWNVVADPVVGGLPTVGFTTSVAVGPKGAVTYANGWLGSPDKGDRYPLIGTAAGIQRLNDEQARILIAPAPGVTGPEAEPRVVRVTGVRLGLQLFSTFEKTAPAYLVPTYLFATDGGELPVVAVTDRYLGQQPAPHDDEPGTPAEPSAGCTGSGSGSAPGQEQTGQQFEVCSPDTAKAGVPVTFTVTAKGNVRDDCGSPVPDWGDGSQDPICAIGCASLPTEPREVSRSFEHIYAEPGTYTATFHFKGCGTDTENDQATLRREVRVEG